MTDSQLNSLDYLQSGLNLIQQAISIFDADLKLVTWNTRFISMFQLPKNLVEAGKDYADILRYLVQVGEYGDIDDVEQYIQDRIDQALAFEPHYFERKRVNGMIISIEGHPLGQGGWVTVYTDITETKQNEQLLASRSEDLSEQLTGYASELSSANRELKATISDLEETKRRLTDSEERMRLALKFSPAHIAQINLGKQYTYTNGGLSGILSDLPQDIIGLKVKDVWGADNYKKLKPALEKTLHGKRETIELTDEKNGKRVRVALTPHIANGQVIGANALSLDITEETISREIIAQANRRSTAAMMVSGLAHDFANLLVIIQSAQNKLRITDHKEVNDAADVIRSASERGRALISRISQMTTGGSEKSEPVDINAVLRELDYLVQPIIQDGIRLKIPDDRRQIFTMIDRGYLVDCLINLVINAQDALSQDAHNHDALNQDTCHEHNNSGEITITVEKKDKRIHLCVCDTGPGFSEEALQHGFKPFFTTKPDLGTGLGLSMLFDLVKQSGGQVKLSNHDNGAQIDIYFNMLSPEVTLHPGRALLVEDDPVIRSEHRQILRSIGLRVVEASRVEDAFSLLDDDQYDLIVSDLDLGQNSINQTNGDIQTGLDVAQRARKENIHCILCSSLPASHILRQIAEREFLFLPKPLNKSALSNLTSRFF